MSTVFDTSVLINLENKDSGAIAKITDLKEIYPAPSCITFMNYFEFLYGIRFRSVKNREKALVFLEKFQCIYPTKKTAEILSDLKEKYEKKGNSFALADLMIAAQSVENRLILVTSDGKFREIEELKSIII